MNNFIKFLFMFVLIIQLKNGLELQFPNGYKYNIRDFGKTCYIHNLDYSEDLTIPMENILFVSYTNN